ncbi:helix-turn-helix domain-containing protein [Fictibacillus sp. KIGAM418]|uniref:Helix-turn-helix domain-containing protein n=1 Tax=Fictibacillus marinisediminis TaxID=2878389 RepID=A0A9X1X975_9BACL|nr:helix-turn-helix domain-containing protein [Fictibacillus marinisediminis]MCK6256309.1 helix-turn-helix domain-containing protein [Fictibacillus marinisediminis]
MKNYSVALSIICLAIGITAGSWFISDALSSPKAIHTTTGETAQKQLLTQSELAGYLGLTAEEVKKLGPQLDSGDDLESELPFIKVGSTVYFPKKGVDKWLRETQSMIIQ